MLSDTVLAPEDWVQEEPLPSTDGRDMNKVLYAD